MRLFFAAWPDAIAAAQLALVAEALAELAQGKPVPQEKIHLTLAFLGEIDAGAQRSAVEVAASLQATGFEMTLDQVGAFRGARVAWAGCSRTPPELAGLESALESRLRGRGFTLDERPFVPHVTLVRKIGKPVPRAPMPAIGWKAGEITLVKSETGTGRYAVLEKWRLG